ncbi:hypothetical protein KEU06_09280 [Pseudaminobacter sp. 19-2017]|uniref:Uncharacterized protein n=1 Tax=Pseudaminobacter soli (ex Zhang et al. 2022) TaxID=2831468 RepID=A0A942DWY2_9HYPH|nr:hypothetical protein [Pseudaminobacter soli]MBS3648796.1 hypothetical protein [Pseudaminobacter soli]
MTDQAKSTRLFTFPDKLLVATSLMEARRIKRVLGLGDDWRPVGLYQNMAGFRASKIVVIGVKFYRGLEVDLVEQLRSRLRPGGDLETI